MSVTTTEDWISIKQFCKLFPGRTGRGISRATAMRWMFRGVGNVQLKSTKIGGTRYVSREAVEEFIAALNGQTRDAKPADRTRDSKLVEQMLMEEGF